MANDEVNTTLPSEEHEQIVEQVKQSVRLPFGFAKRHSVLLAENEEQLTLHCTETVDVRALAEVRRNQCRPIQVSLFARFVVGCF